VDIRRRLQDALVDNAAQLQALERQHVEIVAASRDSNADDEHDPEGATIAFERQQVVALREQLLRTRADIERALAAADHGTCEGCGEPIAPERLEARPSARTCITCARGRLRP
jgi:RNA polymerase-binding transcription factor DksA